MNLTEDQRISISNALQDVLEEAKGKFRQYLKEQDFPCNTGWSPEQINNYNTFPDLYFNKLRDNAPSSEELINYTH